MNKILLSLFIILLSVNNAKATEVEAVYWPKNSAGAYSECNPILPFSCTMSMGATSNINQAQIGTQIIVFDKKNNQIANFKIKKIHYEMKDNMCWLTDQPIRKFTTYFAISNCKVIK
jgi:hypothetical protein